MHTKTKQPQTKTGETSTRVPLQSQKPRAANLGNQRAQWVQKHKHVRQLEVQVDHFGIVKVQQAVQRLNE